jgi:hypothetical protein
VSLLDEGRVGYFLSEEEYTELSSYLVKINQASNRQKSNQTDVASIIVPDFALNIVFY